MLKSYGSLQRPHDPVNAPRIGYQPFYPEKVRLARPDPEVSKRHLLVQLLS